MRTVDSEVRARGGSVSIGIDIGGTKCALSVGAVACPFAIRRPLCYTSVKISKRKTER